MVAYVEKKTYFVAVSEHKVLFLGTDYATIMKRYNEEKPSFLHRIRANTYRDAAMTAAESFELKVSDEVLENFKHLRGYKPSKGDQS